MIAKSTMMIAVFLGLFAVPMTWASADDAVQEEVTPEPPPPVRIGTFDVDVSPPIGSPLAYDPCDGVAMSLRAKGVVVLSDEQPIVLCAVDWIGISNASHQEWRQAIAAATDTTMDRVCVHTLHQHDAPFCDSAAEAILASHGMPGTLIDPKFAQHSIVKVAQAAAQAVADAKVVTHLGVGQATVEKVASNRRILGVDGTVRATRYTACADPNLRMEPEGIIDPRLKSISFWAHEKPLVVTTYYATHPQSYYRRGIANPDFPGMARHLRQVTMNGLPHVHFNGAGGNIGAGKYNDGSEENRQELTVRMAAGMAQAFATTEKMDLNAEDIQWTSTSVAVPPGTHLEQAKLKAILEDEASTLLAKQSAATNLAWLTRCQNGDTITIGCLTIGNVSIVHLPGEPVVEYQLYAQELAPHRFVAVAGYGDYGTGYICLEEHYAQGGYEASARASRVAPEVEAVLKQAIRDVLP